MSNLEDLTKNLANYRFNGKKDHIITDCPFCKKIGHFYINVNKLFKKEKNKYLSSWDCKKCSETGNAKKLFKKLGLLDILEQGKHVGLRKVEFLRPQKIKAPDPPFLPSVKLPVKSQRVFKHPYLTERKVTDEQTNKYGFYISKSPKFKDYLIVEVIQNGVRVGYLGRYFKDDLDILNKKRKLDGLPTIPKWRNSHSEFNRMLNGIDEVKFGVKWVILVEGFFDKTNLEKLLPVSEDIRVCQKFGKKISQSQIRILKNRGIKNIILIEDPDALSDTRHNSSILKANFKNVLVGYNGDVDLGDSTLKHIEQIFNELKTPVDFRTKIVRPKMKL